MKCQLGCGKEFDVIRNIDNNIEDQPVVICLACSNAWLQDAAWNTIWLQIERAKQEKGKRCE